MGPGGSGAGGSAAQPWARRAAAAGLASALWVGGPAVPRAEGQGVRPVLRADLFMADVAAAHIGAGVTTDLGSYVRLDAVAGAGAARIGDDVGASGRAEVIGRFLLDPFRQSRWGPYAGAGLVVRADQGEEGRALLTIVVGVELPARRRWVGAVEAGLGGGVRIGLAVRRGREGRR